MPNFSRDDIVSTSRKEKTSYSRSANSGTSASMSQREAPSKQASKSTTRSYSDRDDLVRVQARRETRVPISSAAARKQSDKAARKAVFQQVWAQYLGAGPAPSNRAQTKDKSLYKNIQDRDFIPGDKESFVAAMMPHALQIARQTGVDPKIVIAQAALETGWGKSAPGNNFFGVKSHGKSGGGTYATTEYVNGAPVQVRDAFRGYRGMGESVRDYGRFLKENPRYGEMLAAEGLENQVSVLGRSGYATDPEYAAKIHQIAKGIDLGADTAPDLGGLRPKARPEAWRTLIKDSEGRGDLSAVDGWVEEPQEDLGGLRPERRPYLTPSQRVANDSMRALGQQPFGPRGVDFGAREEANGLPKGFLYRTAVIESGLDWGAFHPKSKAAGLFQFVPGTAKAYGLEDPFDVEAATDAAAQLAADNARILRKALGREPTGAELYLAHQQGAGGASRLLTNPNALAADIVGAKAVEMNGGKAGMTAGEFANKWLQKFGALEGEEDE